MVIRIKGMDADAFTEVNEAFGCGGWYLENQVVKEDDVLLVDVMLNDNVVILKTHGEDEIMLDKGGVKMFIDSSNFKGITIV